MMEKDSCIWACPIPTGFVMKTIWIDRGNDLEVDQAESATNTNYPFAQDDLQTPLRTYQMVRLRYGRRRAQQATPQDAGKRHGRGWGRFRGYCRRR